MSAKVILAELKKMGTAQNRKIYVRHGAHDPMFGVSYANLGKLTKRIKTDHSLAIALWDSGYHDAQVLAMKVADPAAAKAGEIDRWYRSLKSGLIANELGGFVAKTKFAESRAIKWVAAKGEWQGTAGWSLVTCLAKDSSCDDDFFLSHLDVIESSIHDQKNKVRDAMNWALIAIGCRNAKLQKRALAVAKAIGKVKVDHGETSCTTKDAAAYIRKTKAHYAAKKKKPSRKKKLARRSRAKTRVK